MGPKCAHLLADLFLYSYAAEFPHNLVNNIKLKDAKSFNFTYRFIDDVLSINNPSFGKWVSSIYTRARDIGD